MRGNAMDNEAFARPLADPMGFFGEDVDFLVPVQEA